MKKITKLPVSIFMARQPKGGYQMTPMMIDGKIFSCYICEDGLRRHWEVPDTGRLWLRLSSSYTEDCLLVRLGRLSAYGVVYTGDVLFTPADGTYDVNVNLTEAFKAFIDLTGKSSVYITLQYEEE